MKRNHKKVVTFACSKDRPGCGNRDAGCVSQTTGETFEPQSSSLLDGTDGMHVGRLCK